MCIIQALLSQRYGDVNAEMKTGIVFLTAELVADPGENVLQFSSCNLTSPFVILHNCCHPGKADLFLPW